MLKWFRGRSSTHILSLQGQDRDQLKRRNGAADGVRGEVCSCLATNSLLTLRFTYLRALSVAILSRWTSGSGGGGGRWTADLFIICCCRPNTTNEEGVALLTYVITCTKNATNLPVDTSPTVGLSLCPRDSQFSQLPSNSRNLFCSSQQSLPSSPSISLFL